MTGLNSGPTGCVAAQYIGEVPHFISLTDGQLTESVHGDSWTNPISVGPAKPDSVVTYLDFGDRRHVICLNENNELQNYEYDPDEGEWEAGTLDQLHIAAHPKTAISATYGDNAGHVYFQSPAGKVQEVFYRDGNWKAGNAPSGIRLEFGARLASAFVKDTAFVFYTHPDHSIHQISVKGNEWHDSLVDGTNDGLEKLSIAAGSDDNGFELKYINNKLECLNYAGGEATKLGLLTDDGFSPISNAQTFLLRRRRVINQMLIQNNRSSVTVTGDNNTTSNTINYY